MTRTSLPCLNADYVNFRIPEGIREQGKEAVARFRDWFKKNQHLLDQPAVFAMRIMAAFSVQINPESIERGNSGMEVRENLELADLEVRINELISKAGSYFKNNAYFRKVIHTSDNRIVPEMT